MEENAQSKVINLLAENEKIIGELYSAIAQNFTDPNQYNFFITLSFEEQAHAEWILSLYTDVVDCRVSFNPDRFDLNEIKSFADRVKKKLDEVKKSTFTWETALKVALDIENVLLENKWFEIFERDSEKFNYSLYRLKNATCQHREKIAEAIKNTADK
jgi:hypothetical protein